MVRALLLGIPIMLACGGTRGPDPIELTPETIEEAARVLSEAAERNPDFAFEDGGFRVRASTYRWEYRFEPPKYPGGNSGRMVRFKALTGPRITWWRLEDICAVWSQEWLFSAGVEVHLNGHKEPWLLEMEDPAEVRRIVNAIGLLMRGSRAAPDQNAAIDPPAGDLGESASQGGQQLPEDARR